jgi:hypothetical protein
MDFTDKANSLAKKMNELTEKFSLSEEMIISGDDIIEDVKKKTDIIDLSSDKPKIIPTIDVEIEQEFNTALVLELVNLKAMIEDFQYIRETLKETTDNGRSVLNKVTIDLLDSDEDGRASLILSFAELNAAVGKNMSLYMDSYKLISNVLVNLDKIIKNTNTKSSSGASVVNNTQVNITSTEAVSTAELLNRMRIAKIES